MYLVPFLGITYSNTVRACVRTFIRTPGWPRMYCAVLLSLSLLFLTSRTDLIVLFDIYLVRYTCFLPRFCFRSDRSIVLEPPSLCSGSGSGSGKARQGKARERKARKGWGKNGSCFFFSFLCTISIPFHSSIHSRLTTHSSWHQYQYQKSPHSSFGSCNAVSVVKRVSVNGRLGQWPSLLEAHNQWGKVE